jgi:hypothetical protein
MKYTVPSSKTAKGTAATRKFGFFESEADVVAWIREKTGLAEGQRHPVPAQNSETARKPRDYCAAAIPSSA